MFRTLRPPRATHKKKRHTLKASRGLGPAPRLLRAPSGARNRRTASPRAPSSRPSGGPRRGSRRYRRRAAGTAGQKERVAKAPAAGRAADDPSPAAPPRLEPDRPHTSPRNVHAKPPAAEPRPVLDGGAATEIVGGLPFGRAAVPRCPLPRRPATAPRAAARPVDLSAVTLGGPRGFRALTYAASRRKGGSLVSLARSVRQ